MDPLSMLVWSILASSRTKAILALLYDEGGHYGAQARTEGQHNYRQVASVASGIKGEPLAQF